ncbi:His-Xaa-Ser system protein HxsD [Candidatus Parcubacteria bacterium]|nr:His-Xaa-Ser system protein HxsD [Patescibacteria group bacterium]MBU4309586.1 His-Xaa-Ser system protein HxsD [Patescibacteria group bacterium]MBU4432548.1 His-Xaa-Ser system protein HxsD [Patescibacteria group bacterium]MBU4578026.1 His-Xaa-Ser system protein HxsD [Patescibacteria group bacterium]MCG2696466.1 His-Xaa-Ser system protein HxsD [Candidatus Parcubacteria bacterium]
MKIKMKIENNEISFNVKTSVYSQAIIMKTCYVFIDRVYVYLDKPSKDEILVVLKGKDILSKKDLEKIKGEFSNELLNTILREDLVKQNKKVIEYIVGGAISAALEKKEPINNDNEVMDVEKEIEALKKELEKIDGGDYESDSLNIKKII